MMYDDNAFISIDGSDYKHVKGNLANKDIDINQNSLKTYGEWVSGRPIVIWFNEYDHNTSDQLNVKVKWFLSSSIVYSSSYEKYSPIYEYNLRSDRKKFDEMTIFNKDQDNNFIHDDYETQKPKVETLEASNIEKYSAVLNGKVTDDGDANISERGFYLATHSNPTENDEHVKVTGGGFSEKVDLESNHDYYYRAYAVNEKGQQLSEDAVHFKTLNAEPEVKITEPAEDTSFQKGETVTIKATANDEDGGIEKVEFFIGSTKIKTFTSTQSTYSFDWDTSNATKGEKEIKVTATDSDGKTITTPPRTIIIRDGNLKVTNPNSNTVWHTGDNNVKIEWDTGNIGGNVSIELFDGDSKIGNIKGSTLNDGSYNEYDVQQTLNDSKDYIIKITSIEYPSKKDFSDYFEIKEPVNLAPEAPKVESPKDGDEIAETSETLFWSCSDPEEDPLTYDVYFGTTKSPPKKNSSKLTNSSYDLPNLVGGTEYFWYVIAHDDHGNSTQSDVWSFKVLKQATKPDVITNSPSEITTNSAKIGGEVTSDGGSEVTESGVYWGILANPENTGTKLPIGKGTGQFSETLDDLSPGTTYYIKAYAINSFDISYGNEENFTTENSGNSGTFQGETITVSGGTFNMGSNDGESDEQPIHSVTLSSFNISKYEITNQQYADYMNAIGANSDGSIGGVEYLNMGSSYNQITYSGGSFVVNSGKENYPVVLVSWYGAKAYSEYYGGRLPTEAEWEFAARGGNSSKGYGYSGSNTLDDVAWYSSNSGYTIHTVGTKNANELGLHDMSGNVWEWVNDWDGSYSSSPSNNPQGPSSGTHRVDRGGGRGSVASVCRVANRAGNGPTFTNNYLGFRPVFFP